MEGGELLEAARAGELERVKALVGQGTSVDKDNALRWAAREGRLAVVRYLVANGAALNSTDYRGDTALMRAAEGGHTDVVRFLTEHCKADVNAFNANGYSALMWAARSGQVEVVRYLAGRRGVNLDVKDMYGYSALMKACKGGKIDVVKCLAAAGADVNESDDVGYTALMIASGCGHIEIVRCLVEVCAAVVNARNNRGETAVRVASDCGYSDVEQYLTPFLRHSPPSVASTARSAAESDDQERSMSVSIAPSEIEPIDFRTSSGMGASYHRVKWLDADASVKLFIPDTERSLVEEEEARFWQGLRHPNVISMYGICDAVPRLPLFVYEYSSKGTLMDYVKSIPAEGSSSWRYLHEAAVGLAYLHNRRVIHGNLCCENIVIGSDGRAKLFDMITADPWTSPVRFRRMQLGPCGGKPLRF